MLMDSSVDYQFSFMLMMCLSVETFCCCISLEVAAQVIGIVNTLMSALLMVLYGAAAFLVKLSDIRMMFYAMMGLTSGLQTLFGVLLCYGAFQRRPKFMWPSLLIMMITGVALLGLSITGYVVLGVGANLTTEASLVISSYVIYSLFLLYCGVVVNSRRLELMKDEKESESHTTLMRYPSAFKYA